ncbi:MAG: bacteriorhodopsin [Rubrobacteraceae bacterium]
METFLLWIGVVGFVAATAFFIYLSSQAPAGSRHFHIITAVITGTAAFSYLMMATGAGFTELSDGRGFYYFRYIDWLITTPLLLLDLALLALVDWRRNSSLVVTLIVLDVVMILTGLLAGSRISGFGRGFWFIVSTAAMVYLLYLVYTRLFSAASNQSAAVNSLFGTLAILTLVLWSLYPIVWLLGTEGFNAVGSGTEVFLFLILDFLAKIGFGFLLLTNRQAISDAGGGGQQASSSRVR